MNAVLHALKSHPLFKSLWGGTLQALAKSASIIELPKGSILFRQGDPADAMYVVISGRLQATHTNATVTHEVIELYGPDATFGERALFTDDPHWTTTTVITDARIIRLDIKSVKRALLRSSFLARELAGRMGQHVRKISRMSEARRGAHIAALATVSPIVNMTALAGEIATMLHEETRRTVLILRVIREPGHPALSDLYERPLTHALVSNWLEKTARIAEGVSQFTIHMGQTSSEASQVAPLLGHLSNRFDEILVLCDSRTSSPSMFEFLLQCDEAYLLAQPDEQQYRQARQVILLLRTQPDRGHHARIRPLIWVAREEPAPLLETVAEILGQEPHMILMDTPTPSDIQNGQVSVRHQAHLRTLAREIGRCRVGLVLSAGGARGLAHVGVIQVLEEHGIHIDAVAGTSMGALVGALWCYGLDGTALEKIARRQERPRILFKMIDPVFPPRIGFMKGGYIRKLLQDELGHAQFTDLVRPLRVVTTDIDTLEKIVIDRGEVWSAVLASTSLPAIIMPFHLMGRNLVDGGISDPLPVEVLREMGIEKIIAVNTIPNPEDIRNFRLARPAAPPPKKYSLFKKEKSILNQQINYFAEGNILDIILKSVHGAGCRLAEYAGLHADIVLKPILRESTFHDFQHPGRYIEEGRRVTAERIDEILELFKPEIDSSGVEDMIHETSRSI